MKIEVAGKTAGENWKRKAEQLNNNTEKLLGEVSKTLEKVQAVSDGTLVDEIAEVGTTLITSTTKLMEGMNGLLTVVDKLLGFLDELFSTVSGATKVVRNLLG